MVNRPVPLWVIDRVENGWAVLENGDTMESISLPVEGLPGGVKPGDTLVRVEGKWHRHDAETAARKKQIGDRFARIKAANARG